MITQAEIEAARRKLFELADVVVEKREMEAALEAAARVRWQPVETAPDDQRHILAIHLMNGAQRVTWTR